MAIRTDRGATHGRPSRSQLEIGRVGHDDGAEGFTVPRPIRDYQGNWVHDGWQAIEWIPGVADETRVRDVVRAGQAFHGTIATLPRPSFISASNNPWSNADRIAWGEMPLPAEELLQLLSAEF